MSRSPGPAYEAEIAKIKNMEPTERQNYLHTGGVCVANRDGEWMAGRTKGRRSILANEDDALLYALILRDNA